MLDFLKVIAIYGSESVHLVLVDLLVICGGDYGRGEGVPSGMQLGRRSSFLLLRPRGGSFGGMVVLLVLVRHSGAWWNLGGVELNRDGSLPKRNAVTKMQPKLQPSISPKGTLSRIEGFREE